jgi:hypothetical protein
VLKATKTFRLRKKIFNLFRRNHGKFVVNYQPKPKVIPFEEARKVMTRLGLRNVKEYKELCKRGKLPYLPVAPDAAYKDKGWIDWYDFLGHELYHIKPLPFKEAKKIVKDLRIKTYREYYKLYRQKKLPKGLPSTPSDTYKDQGWISWSDFSGHEGSRVKPLPFEQTEEIVRSLNISGKNEYYKLYRQGKLPRGLPANPSDTYRNKGWISWYSYLGNEMPTKMLPFREAREIVRKLGIKNPGEYFSLHKEGKLPRGLPHDPNDVYSKERMNR